MALAPFVFTEWSEMPCFRADSYLCPAVTVKSKIFWLDLMNKQNLLARFNIDICQVLCILNVRIYFLSFYNYTYSLENLYFLIGVFLHYYWTKILVFDPSIETCSIAMIKTALASHFSLSWAH